MSAKKSSLGDLSEWSYRELQDAYMSVTAKTDRVKLAEEMQRRNWGCDDQGKKLEGV